DLRQATLARARVGGAKLTGAKVAGLTGTGAPLGEVQAGWVGTIAGGDGTGRVSNGEISSLLSGLGASVGATAPAGPRRYFGHGDVLRNATPDFPPGARLQSD